MKIKLQDNGYVENAFLTDESALASPGKPVLRIEDGSPADYGPADIISIGKQTPVHAASIVVDWAKQAGSREEKEVAAQFTRQWPDGPQVLIEESV